ncbi:hypothetical protein O6H91_12G103000 [Diphasiastrum complanatum]|uniref:Uncharacterized protein n=1 Tax=Diphasiastrum complanatum TaxID=34168 RepID=A0ACC2C5D5_DIPCM|nr:hypothetical protein O6H91_12G103000 [Diphasiastrum complanatum]
MGESEEKNQRWRSLRIVLPDAMASESGGVAYLFLHRPSRSNALNPDIFQELPLAIAALDSNPNVRVIVLQGSGKHFCAGIDLGTLANADHVSNAIGRHKEQFARSVKQMQAAFTAFEECRKPVIAAIHGACLGAGVDMITACDLRYCTKEALFSVKEVDLAITADLGTLQRLPGIVGYGHAIDLALTGRTFNGSEAKTIGLVQEVFASKQELDDKVGILAHEMATKSPLSVMGIKSVLLKSRDLTVAQGLDYVRTWSTAFLHSEDLEEVVKARAEKRKPVFSKL